MTSWERVQELFEGALEVDGARRHAFLHEQAHGDGELVHQVEALLAADAAPLRDFERTATDLLQELSQDPPAEELCGKTFGAYYIEEHLSTGGMGQVYRATRKAAGTERRVALKVLRPGLDTDAFFERFQRERQTLAALEHENIVAFVDASALPDGRPFLAMEFVDGIPLTTWARTHGIAQRERIELFLLVVGAVQYAHHKLVLHRDLKPSNVLVTSQGMPKLLDFGVASALQENEAASGHAPLTPSYASPEQRAGEALTTSSDVYSLGVLLHELLTGELPAARTHSHLESDLEAILSKALAQDPAQRYSSADRLADDLRAHLADEAISARPSTWTDRSRRLVRRHRWTFATTLTVLAALTIGWIGSDIERRHARRESSLGWGAHAQARVTARILEGWITRAVEEDPEMASDAAQYLESALTEDLHDLPETETLLRMALADLYLRSGAMELGASHAERAWELAQTTRGLGNNDRRRAEELRQRFRAEGR